MQIYAFSVLLGESEGIHFSGFKTEPIICQEKVKAQIRSIWPNIKPKQIGPAYHTLHMIVRVLHYQHWKYILVKFIIVPLKRHEYCEYGVISLYMHCIHKAIDAVLYLSAVSIDVCV